MCSNVRSPEEMMLPARRRFTVLLSRSSGLLGW
jgi:hypothetical protein